MFEPLRPPPVSGVGVCMPCHLAMCPQHENARARTALDVCASHWLWWCRYVLAEMAVHQTRAYFKVGRLRGARTVHGERGGMCHGPMARELACGDSRCAVAAGERVSGLPVVFCWHNTGTDWWRRCAVAPLQAKYGYLIDNPNVGKVGVQLGAFALHMLQSSPGGRASCLPACLLARMRTVPYAQPCQSMSHHGSAALSG